jgi:hypothetical protein
VSNYRGVCLVVFALLWSALWVSFEQSRAVNLARQFASRNYQSAIGWVVRSEVTRRHVDSPIEWKSETVYGVDIRYEYKVHGQSFSSSSFRYNIAPSSSSDADWAESLVAAHPVGSQTQVFYHPENPADSVLSPGLDGRDFVLVLFLTPFNCVTVGLWLSSAIWLRHTLLNPIAGGVYIRLEAQRVRVRLPRFRPESVALVALGIMAFIAAFSLGTHPTFIAGSLVCCSVFAAAASLYAWLLRKVHSGDHDLVIDHAARTVSLPRTFGRRETIVISFSDIAAIESVAIEHWSFEGGLSVSFAPIIRLRDAQRKALKLANWYDQQRSEAFAAWLRTGIEFQSADG